jgi:hypothetical protein
VRSRRLQRKSTVAEKRLFSSKSVFFGAKIHLFQISELLLHSEKTMSCALVLVNNAKNVELVCARRKAGVYAASGGDKEII